MEMDISGMLDAIKADNLSGSVAISRETGDLFIYLAENWPEKPLQRLKKEVRQISSQLITAQPSMALLHRLVSEIMTGLEKASALNEGLKIIKEKTKTFHKRLAKGTETIITQAQRLIPDNSTIITHSYSATVYQVFLRACEEKKKFRITCMEARPMLEGALLAEQLAKAGIKVTLIADSAVFQLVPQASLIIVGADAIFPTGVVNKIGTKGVALAAQEVGIPFYVLCNTEKLWPQLPSEPLETIIRPAEELYQKRHPNMLVSNFYFDLTPLPLVSGILTEKGIFDHAAISALFRK
jgi:translation initiation factor 2B subunit (eIF-2B alpha/beta/delta family)